MLDGGMEAAQEMFQQLAGRGKVVEISGQMTRVQLPNGSYVGLRTFATKSPGTVATIDVDIPGINIKKLKYE